jgi:hypothetical protein
VEDGEGQFRTQDQILRLLRWLRDSCPAVERVDEQNESAIPLDQSGVWAMNLLKTLEHNREQWQRRYKRPARSMSRLHSGLNSLWGRDCEGGTAARHALIMLF